MQYVLTIEINCSLALQYVDTSNTPFLHFVQYCLVLSWNLRFHIFYSVRLIFCTSLAMIFHYTTQHELLLSTAHNKKLKPQKYCRAPLVPVPGQLREQNEPDSRAGGHRAPGQQLGPHTVRNRQTLKFQGIFVDGVE